MVSKDDIEDLGSSRGYRADLEGRLPIVYNGKSAEEWYTLYCQEVLRVDRLRKELGAVIVADDTSLFTKQQPIS